MSIENLLSHVSAEQLLTKNLGVHEVRSTPHPHIEVLLLPNQQVKRNLIQIWPLKHSHAILNHRLRFLINLIARFILPRAIAEHAIQIEDK